MRERLDLYSRNTLKLGLFGANCSSGRAVTKVPERWSGNWPDGLRLARMADAAGIEFMLPVGRWKGYGGETDYQGSTLESVIWAAGLLAATQRLTVFATVHAPLIHPVIAAKQFVTADHIGAGRFGLNVVCGWNEDEFDMFGVTLREHATRYDYAQEWLDAIKRAWGDEDDFDFDGNFIKLRRVRAKPKPFGGGRPIIMNAAASPTGQSFAMRNCDALFSMTPKGKLDEFAAHVVNVKALARAQGREIEVYTVGVVTCRPTRREAETYYRHCVIDNADWAAVDHIMAMRGVTAEKYPDDFAERRAHQANGMGGVPIVGDPDDVADEMARLSAAGARGIAVSFVNYIEELPFFCNEVLPRLEQRGLRCRAVA
jgi:alkanesulfonate monooxygenase SsuD/methylene tetrahydromethanopterin reductase-like flavin-dependent oxidoreductase (luciferase family)